jgi:hypothetical protein
MEKIVVDMMVEEVRRNVTGRVEADALLIEQFSIGDARPSVGGTITFFNAPLRPGQKVRAGVHFH